MDLQKKEQKIDSRITLLHILGMLLILFCHFFQEVKIYFISEILISGVQLFFFVAGYLCGRKKIEKPVRWILQKAKRILLPYYFLLLIVFLIYQLSGKQMLQPSSIFLLFNIQGLNYLVWPFRGYGAPAGLGHLWFVTIIMLCYLITPLFQKMREWLTGTPKKWLKYVILALAIGVQFLLLLVGVQSSYLIIYFVGYMTKELVIDLKKLLGLTGLTAIVLFGRLLLRRYVDGSLFYDRYYCLISNAAIAIWIVYAVAFLFAKIPALQTFFAKKIWLFIEAISYYVYLVHFVFLRGEYPISSWVGGNTVLADFLVIVFSAVVASGMSFLFDKLLFRKKI